MKFTNKITRLTLLLALAASVALAGVAGKKLNDGSVNATKMRESLRTGEYVYEVMDHQPSVSLLANGYADPDGTGPNRAQFRNGLHVTFTPLGTQTPIFGPVFSVTEGLEISQDDTDDDGVQYVFGALGTAGAWTHTVGTDADRFFRLKFEISDVSGTDDCAVCWRKNEAVQAAIDDYDEMACVNIISGNVNVETILNAAATTTTDVTGVTDWADGGEHTVEVQIRGRRVVFLYDGSPLPGVPAFNFDSGEVILPMFFFLNSSDKTELYWKFAELGFVNDKNTNASDDAL